MATSISSRGKAAVFLVVAVILAAFVALGAVVVSRSRSASGEVATVGGGAFGESVHIQTILGARVDSGPAPSVDLPPGGGGPITDDLVSVDVPGVLSTGVLEVSTEGAPGPDGFLRSSASVVTLQLAGGAITVDLVKSECRADSSGTTGSATIQNLRIAGAPVASVDPPPNTTIEVPAVGTLILNEQTGGSAGGGPFTVNAIHLRLNSGVLGTGDIIVAQSRCQTIGPDVVIPVGAVGGIGLAAVIGALLFWKLTARRPDATAGPSPATRS